MGVFSINALEIDDLQQAMKNFQGNTEKTINDVLHNEAGPLIQEGIKRLMPTSNRTWKGKKGQAKTSKSLKNENSNLAVTVKTTSNYQYLYFPDDGSNTKNHVGNQQFFLKGGESKTEEIINLCIKNLVNDFENSI